MLDTEAYSAKKRGSGVHAAPARVPQHQAADEEGEGGGGEGGEGEHVGDVGTLRGVQLCLLSPLLPIHSGAGSANQFNAKEKKIIHKQILKANISLHTYCKGTLIPHICWYTTALFGSLKVHQKVHTLTTK